MKVDILLFTDNTAIAFSRVAGAYRVATELRKNGYTVQVVDHFLMAGLARILQCIDLFVGPDTLFVGFSSTFMNMTDKRRLEMISHIPSFDIVSNNIGPKDIAVPEVWSDGIPISDYDLNKIKERVLSYSPNIKLVLGGTKAYFERQDFFDAFIVGYADNTIVQYAKFLQGKNPFLQYRAISPGKIVIDNDLDATGFDFVHSTIEYKDNDFIQKSEVLPLEVARGCIFRCKFCGYQLNGKKKLDYIKDRDILYSELMRNYDNFGVTKYMFSDDTYNDSVEKIEYNAEIFSRLPFSIEFSAYLRHDLIWRFPEMGDILRESGLKYAIFGIETLNHTAGKIIGKGLSPELTKETLYRLRTTNKWLGNILMSSGFIIGLPTESAQTVTEWTSELIDMNYPLDSFLFTTLGIKRYPKAEKFMSEFELNYEKYGYYFDADKSASWINKDWCFEDAAIMTDKITKEAYSKGRNKASGNLGMQLRSFGITAAQIHSTPAHILLNGIFDKTINITDEYYSKLLNYEN